MAQECLLLLFVVFYFLILLSAADGVENCPKFHCGQLGELHFPFTNTGHRPECGLYIKGCDIGAPQVKMGNEEWYNITRIFQIGEENSISVTDPKLEQFLSWQNCTALDGYLPPSPFPEFSPMISVTTPVMPSLKLLRCNHSPWDTEFFQSLNFNCHPLFYGFVTPGKEDQFKSCSSVSLPVGSYPNPNANLIPNSDPNDIYHFLTDEITFTVTLSPDCHKCYYERGGQCQFVEEKFECVAAGTEKKDRKRVFIVATVASIIGVAVLVILLCCYKRSVLFRKNENLTHQTIENFLKYQLYLSTKRYSYSEIKKVTNTFRDKLGKGGYGTVYKGKLPDGRLVAVKVLSDTKGNGEEFINEVASISRTSHVNIVSLLGFCLQGSKRALVYEFMHNGSLEKFLYQESVLMNDYILDCKTLYEIAVGVARGLEYLHRGCNTRILHFDIKPHNILLDEHFCPKISDFGLAKICSRKESIVSMLGARGTAGYIAPEVFCRNFGGVSHKSDVYSYGMLILEMFGGRKNMNVEEDCNSEIYFPDWIYKRLELNEKLRLGCIKNERDEERVRKVTLVSLWCIQANPSTRPTMSKVVEMLEGSLESLQVPPKPILSSPLRSPTINSTQTCDTL